MTPKSNTGTVLGALLGAAAAIGGGVALASYGSKKPQFKGAPARPMRPYVKPAIKPCKCGR